VQSGTATANLVGNATLEKTTAGSAILSGINAYTGNTTISGGALTFLNASSLYGGNATRWNSGNITAASGSTVAFGVGADGGFSAGNITTIFTNLTQNQTTAGGIQAGANFGIDTNGSNASLSTAFKNRTGTGNGTLALVKMGEGTLTLTGNNTHTGGTIIESGTLTGNDLGVKGNITNNGTLLFGGGSYQTEITGSGALLVAGSTTLLGNATMAGGTTIQSGNLTIGGRNSNSLYIAGSISGNITNNGTLKFDMDSANRTYSGVISGNGKVVTSSVSGITGKLYLTGNNTYTGGTLVEHGTLDISGGSLASSGNVSVTGGAFSIGASNQTVGDFQLKGSSTTNVTGTGSLSASRFDLRAGTVSLSLAGTGDIGKNLLIDNYSFGSSYDNGIVIFRATTLPPAMSRSAAASCPSIRSSLSTVETTPPGRRTKSASVRMPPSPSAQEMAVPPAASATPKSEKFSGTSPGITRSASPQTPASASMSPVATSRSTPPSQTERMAECSAWTKSEPACSCWDPRIPSLATSMFSRAPSVPAPTTRCPRIPASLWKS
jgi:autotransporter-associated beta strand protein